MRWPVYRSTITVSVMAMEDYRRNYVAEEGRQRGAGLDALASDIAGPSLGAIAQSAWELVPDQEVVAACKAMGNDGTCFDVDEEAIRIAEDIEATIDRKLEAKKRREQIHAVDGRPTDGGTVQPQGEEKVVLERPKRSGDSNRRRIVIGDIHGELSGFTEILRHANVMDASQSWVGEDTVLIQTGDVIDRGLCSREAPSLLRTLQQQASDSSGRVVRCCGNHELCLLQGNYEHTTVRNPSEIAEELRREIAAGLVQAAYTDGTRLYTHAGLRSTVREMIVDEITKEKPRRTTVHRSLKALADHINELFRHAVRQQACQSTDHCIFWVGPERGGADRGGGIFWCDFAPFTPSEQPWDIPQVFGHTPSLGSSFRKARGLKLIDVDAGMCTVYGGNLAYLEIRSDGRIVQHSKKGRRWTSKILGLTEGGITPWASTPPSPPDGL